MLLETYDGQGAPRCAQLLRKEKTGGAQGGASYFCDLGKKSRGGASLDRGRPWLPFARDLWVVNHFSRDRRSMAARPGHWSRLTFDFRSAEREIRSKKDVVDAVFMRARVDAGVYDEPHASALDEALRGGVPSAEAMSRLAERQEAPEEPPQVITAVEHPEGTAVARSSLSVSGQPVVRGGYEGMKCAGCGGAFGPRTMRTRITPGGIGMIHDSRKCLDLARRALRDLTLAEGPPETNAEGGRGADVAAPPNGEALPALAPEVLCPPCDPPRKVEGAGVLGRDGSDQRKQQFADRISSDRRARVHTCLQGGCAVQGEAQMICLGRVGGAPCPARLHGRGCAQLTKGHASLGCFLCPKCRVREALPGAADADLPKSALEIAEVTMLVQMSTGAEATGASYFDYQRLEREFMESIGGLAGGVLPSDNHNVFMMFMCWIVTAKERALSLETLVRTAGAVMVKTGRENLTRRADVKSLFEELKVRHGEESTPRTATTRRMMFHVLEEVIPSRGGNELVNTRMQLMFALEVMLGLRVGEVLSGGDFHGLLANYLTILRRLDEWGEPGDDETVEAFLEHSKTKHSRYVNAVGLSKGPARVRLADFLRAYWKAAGMKVVSRLEAGYMVTGPDYSVLRVSLVALSGSQEGDLERIEMLGRILSRSDSSEARRWADYSVHSAKRRLAAESLDKKYVNVVGGTRDSLELAQVSRELALAGFADRISIVPGPLMRATNGAMGYAHMPLQPASTYAMLHECLPKAFELANAESPDPELDLRGLLAPLWGHHSNRRGADTTARNTMHLTGATERDIDMQFGWNEHIARAIMQLHYESNVERDRRSKVTSMM